ncbi:hypothetical protein [Chryseobacterium sp.]|uniref:hypothetical protein n=1 Tax=Chryseobacterium sp. TaxID=1871047 RepID=UPI00289B74C3|nr:hypothetical protein [Chryseobacterium sp.]
MKKNIYKFVTALSLLFLSGGSTFAQYCVSGCNGNAYVESNDPKSIEYDNMVGIFHSSMAKEYNGTLKVWGQGALQNGASSNNNALVPQIVNSANYGTGANQLSGTILKFTGGSNVNEQQFAVLTTNGLYIWGGAAGTMVPLNTTNNLVAGQFRKVIVASVGSSTLKSDGLPTGVNPTDVKMMFGTRDALAIVTCNGQAWMLSSTGTSYGDGVTDNAANDLIWHRVSTSANTPLNNVIAVRGTYQAFMALTYDNTANTYAIYTWGNGTRLGGTGPTQLTASRPFATPMILPTMASGVTPKMIGMTSSAGGKSYYLLASDKRLYSLGDNASRQLGNGNTTESNTWINVLASTTINGNTYNLSNNVVWISPQEHDGGYNVAAINVITDTQGVWSWGESSYGMLGAASGSINPTYMVGRTTGSYDATKLNIDDKILAVETGGHTSLLIKQCTNKFGYIGHRINGSMANGSSTTGNETIFNFVDTSVLNVCGAVSAPDVADRQICPGTSYDLALAEPATLPPGVTGIDWWTDSAAAIPVANPSSVPPGTYYATYSGLIVRCISKMILTSYVIGDPAITQNCACYNPASTTGTAEETKVGITLLKRAGVNSDNWPMVRKSGHIALESNTKGFVITRMTTLQIEGQTSPTVIPASITNPQEGMMVYDTDAKCLKIYSDGNWKCFNKSACP